MWEMKLLHLKIKSNMWNYDTTYVSLYLILQAFYSIQSKVIFVPIKTYKLYFFFKKLKRNINITKILNLDRCRILQRLTKII